jgi:ActR/RegA family two-component response regulator
MKSSTHMSIPESVQAQGSQQGSCPWVLVIDDDRMTGRALARWISHVTGCETRVARTIHQAECWLTAMPRPIALVTDFELAGETGLQAIDAVKSLGLQCPMAVVTAAPDSAAAALSRAESAALLPVFTKSEIHGEFTLWLEALRFAWAATA